MSLSEQLKQQAKMMHYVIRTGEQVTEHHCFAVPLIDVVLPLVQALEGRLDKILRLVQEHDIMVANGEKFKLCDFMLKLEGLASTDTKAKVGEQP